MAIRSKSGRELRNYERRYVQVIIKQSEDAFWAQATEAFILGYTDCQTQSALALFDPDNSEFDHSFNPFVTRSVEWDDYRTGCLECYERHVLPSLDHDDE